MKYVYVFLGLLFLMAAHLFIRIFKSMLIPAEYCCGGEERE